MIRLLLLLLLAPPLPAAADDSRYGRQPVEWATVRAGKRTGTTPTYHTLRRAARRAERSRWWWLGWVAFGSLFFFFSLAFGTAYTILFTTGAAGLVLYPILTDWWRVIRRTI